MTDINTLLARVREDIDNAKENGYDLFDEPLPIYGGRTRTDIEIADDMRACTTGYEDVSDRELMAAVAAIREERANG